MSNLEIILTMILWVIYGVFSAVQRDSFEDYTYPLMIIFSPIVLLYRIVVGIFNKRNIQ